MIVSFLDGVAHDLTTEDVRELAQCTNEWSGADIRNLIREAALQPLRRALLKKARPLEEEESGNGGGGASMLITPDTMTKADVAEAFKVVQRTSPPKRQRQDAATPHPIIVNMIHPHARPRPHPKAHQHPRKRPKTKERGKKKQVKADIDTPSYLHYV